MAMVTGAHNRAVLIAVVLAAAAALAVTALPLCSLAGMDMAMDITTGGVPAATEFRRVHCVLSPNELLITWLPVGISGVALALSRTAAAGVARFVAAAMLLGFVIIAGFSIGLLYAPAAAAMIVAARTGQSAERRVAPAHAME